MNDLTHVGGGPGTSSPIALPSPSDQAPAERTMVSASIGLPATDNWRGRCCASKAVAAPIDFFTTLFGRRGSESHYGAGDH